MSDGFFIVIFTAIIAFCTAYLIADEACDQKTISFEEHQYGFFSGCLVKENGRWLPLENMRGFDSRN